MSIKWHTRISASGRLARVKGGRHVQKLVRFSAEEFDVVESRARESGLEPAAFLHLAGLYFQPPATAPGRFRPALRSIARDQALAAELGPIKRTLSGIDTNLNQLTHLAHRDGLVSVMPQLAVLGNELWAGLHRLTMALRLLDPDEPDEVVDLAAAAG